MLLATVVLIAQVGGAPPERDVVRPCADQSALCRMSPFFCPGTYPTGLEPCWPDSARKPRDLGGREAGNPSSPSRGEAAAPARSSERSRSKAPRKFRFVLED